MCIANEDVSVIVPFFNRSSTIERALVSLLTVGNVEYIGEVIIIDDGSTMQEFEKLNEIVDLIKQKHSLNQSFMKIIRYESNVNAARARNVGILNSIFSYVAFIDSDDEWLPQKLKIQLSAATGNKVTFSQFKKVNMTTSRSLAIHPQYFEPDIPRYILAGGGHVQTSTMLLRRELASKVLFNDKLKKYQDWDFAIRLFAEGAEFEFCNIPLVNYYVDSSDRIGSAFNFGLAQDFANSVSNIAQATLISDFLYSRKVIGHIACGQYAAAYRLIFAHYFIFKLSFSLKQEVIIYLLKRHLLELRGL